jgi:hypothetical protein
LRRVRVARLLRPLPLARREGEAAAVAQIDEYAAGLAIVAGRAGARLGAQRALAAAPGMLRVL